MINFNHPQTVLLLVNAEKRQRSFYRRWFDDMLAFFSSNNFRIVDEGEITVTKELVDVIFDFNDSYRGNDMFRENAYSIIGRRAYGYVIRGDYPSLIEDHCHVGSPWNKDFAESLVYTRPYTGQSDDEDDLSIEIFRDLRTIETQRRPFWQLPLIPRLLARFAA